MSIDRLLRIPSAPIEPHRRVGHAGECVHIPSVLWRRDGFGMPVIQDGLQVEIVQRVCVGEQGRPWIRTQLDLTGLDAIANSRSD